MSEELYEGKAAHDTAGDNEYDASKKGEKHAQPTGKAAKGQGKADANRKADPKAEEVPTSVVPGQQGAQRGGMKEELASAFEEAGLSEDFMEKAETIFEAAVNDRVAELKEELEGVYATRLEEELEGSVNDLVEKIDDYLDYAVRTYMEENALAIESGIAVDVAESFMSGLKTLFVEHNVTVDEEQLDVVAEMTEALEEMENKLNEAIEDNIKLSEQINEHAAADVFASVAEGLTMSEVEKLSILSEDFNTGDLEVYERKLKTVKENYFGSKKVLSESYDEEPLDIAEEKYVDPGIAAVAAAISKSVKK